MEFTNPRVYMLAPKREDLLDTSELEAFLIDIGASGWKTSKCSDGEMLIEIAGKGCYRSFNLDINPNLTRVTEANNKKYIGRSILAHRHGSVLEHVNCTFAFVDVSRIFTHEVVRHRHLSPSQESLRFVRLTELKAYFPMVFRQDYLDRVEMHLRSKGVDTSDFPNEDDMRERFRSVFEFLEEQQQILSKILHLDDLDDFHGKKMLTSAMRRLAPEGLATMIVMTGNLRTWRHVIELRTAAGAEEEIRYVFGHVFHHLLDRFPHVFQDAHTRIVDGLLEVTFDNSRV